MKCALVGFVAGSRPCQCVTLCMNYSRVSFTMTNTNPYRMMPMVVMVNASFMLPIFRAHENCDMFVCADIQKRRKIKLWVLDCGTNEVYSNEINNAQLQHSYTLSQHLKSHNRKIYNISLCFAARLSASELNYMKYANKNASGNKTIDNSGQIVFKSCFSSSMLYTQFAFRNFTDNARVQRDNLSIYYSRASTCTIIILDFVAYFAHSFRYRFRLPFAIIQSEEIYMYVTSLFSSPKIA